MGARSLHHALFSLCLIFSSGLSFGTQLDDVPIVNPTTPGTDNPYPTVNPTTPQGPDTTTGPYPTTPTTTTGPYPTTPTAPDTNPTTPTAPDTNPTTPTTPDTNPTTPTTTTPTTAPGSSGGQWCVASQGASDTNLQVALDYACGYGGADCSQIQPGAGCYNPNTLRDHASYAFNDYYQKNPVPTSCVFGGAATLTSNDPSSGNCHYTSSKTTSISPPTYVSPPSPMTMTPTPPDMSMPGGGSTVYGAEPTGSPDAATSAINSLLLLFTSVLLVSLQLANYI